LKWAGVTKRSTRKMKQEADKFVVFKLAADLVEDEAQSC
jgi:hypothetical protein